MEMVLENGRVPSMKYTGAEAIRAWDRRRNCGWARKSLAPRRSGGRQCRESLWGINALIFDPSEMQYEGHTTGTSY